jgi:hypothetical protein
MKVEHVPTAVTESRERRSYVRLHGGWLVLARGVWLALVILTLAIFFASLPVYLGQLQTPCAPTACQYQQLTHTQAETLQGMGLSLADYATLTVALMFAIMGVCLVVSTLIIWRRPDDRMAVLVALLLVTAGAATVTATAPAASPWLLPDEGVTFLTSVFFVLVFLLFPSGRFVPHWMRWTLVVFLAVQVPFTFFPNAPFMLNTSFFQLGWLVFLGELATVAFVQLYRYRRVSSPLQRQQTKWVVFGLAVPIAVIVLVDVLALLFPVAVEHDALAVLAYNEVGFLLLLIPLSFGFAMLRSRLWEIDVLINRTLVYGTLTASLALVYLGMVIGLQSLVHLLTGTLSEQPLVIVASTLAMAALFHPLRQRIQAIIDRRFYRRKYDAAKTLEAFSATLRQEVDLDQLREHLLTVVQETMQPASLSLWIRPVKQQASKGETRGESLSRGGEQPSADRSDSR